jgi:lipase maturation factor 1
MTPTGYLAVARSRMRDFAGLDGGSTFLWTRWLLLRAVGLVYVIIFAGVVTQAPVLIGPSGIAPVGEFLADQARLGPNAMGAFLRIPTLFWLGSGVGMVGGLGWAGLAAAIALVLNLWPRMALLACWGVFLSYVSPGQFYAATQPDQLMIEAALLCIPFAPPGLRPGLGAANPPRPIALFTLRWFLFRVMFEAGLAKFVLGGPLWRNLTAMDYMYESAPFPTVLGYHDFLLPHAFHVLEIALTFFVEIPAPILMIFGGRRWRWIAFVTWVLFHAGIEATNNFGWLNVAAIGMGLLLLDDRMLSDAARLLRLPRALRFAVPAAPPPAAPSPWRLWGLRLALGAHFCINPVFCALSDRDLSQAVPPSLARAVNDAVGGFRSCNGYLLFGNIATARTTIEFEGSNDGGETWRTYEFRYLPQRRDRIPPFIAPWYPRFEAILQNSTVLTRESPLFPATAAHLLRRDPAVLALFERDPFPGRPPSMVRMSVYRLWFTDLATHRRTGEYWHKEYKGQYMPLMFLDGHGEVVEAE